MTIEKFRFIIDTHQNFEFNFKGKDYNLTYDKDDSGKDFIVFGERYLGKKYESYGELMNKAQVENHFFREVLELL